MNLVRNKMSLLAKELKLAETELKAEDSGSDTEFILGRVKRAQKLRDTAMSVLENPLVKLLTRIS